MSGLEVLSSPYVLIAAGVIYLVEFFADKIPWVDSIWDGVHTIIRPLGAAVIGAAAIGVVEPRTAVIAALCAGVSLSGHSVKAGTRLLANHSPEPFSNIGLSLGEDILVVIGSWLALRHPAIMVTVVVIFLIALQSNMCRVSAGVESSRRLVRSFRCPSMWLVVEVQRLTVTTLRKFPSTCYIVSMRRLDPEVDDFSFALLPEKE
jgi:hypothetical protein